MDGGEFEHFDQLRREYDWTEVPPAVAIIESITELESGEVTGTTPLLDRPLQAYVEVDALDTLVRNENTTAINLRLSAYDIEIRGNTVGVSRVDEN